MCDWILKGKSQSLWLQSESEADAPVQGARVFWLYTVYLIVTPFPGVSIFLEAVEVT